MMKKKLKRLLVLSLIMLLIASILIGCGQSNTNQGNSTNAVVSTLGNKATESSKEELPMIDVVIATPYFPNDLMEPNANNEHDPILKYIGDMFHMNIQVWSGGSGEYHTKLKLQYSSGAGPDTANILSWDGGDTLYKEMLSQNAFVNIGELVFADPQRYAALNKIFQDPFYKIQNVKWNGSPDKYMSLFNISASRLTEGGPAFFMPYLKNVGVTELPTTVDGFIDILRKLKAGDPNKDGTAGDIIPLGLLTYKGTQYRDIDEIFFQSEGTYMKGFTLDYDTGSEYKYYTIDSSHIPIFKKIAQYFKEGLFDPEFITRDGWGAWDLMAQGKCAVITTGLPGNPQSPDAYPPLIDAMNKMGLVGNVTYEDFKMLSEPLKGSNGKQMKKYGLSVSTALMNIIPTTCKNPERVLDLLNFIYSDKGQEVLWYGIPDVTYIKDSDGQLQLIGDKFKDICTVYTPNDLSAVSWDPLLITTDVGRKFCQYERDGWSQGAINGLNLETTRRTQTPAIKYDVKIANDWVDKCFVELPPYFAKVYTEGAMKDKETALKDIENEYFAGFMTGELDVEKNWDKMVKELTDAGYKDVLDEYNRKLAEAKATSN